MAAKTRATPKHPFATAIRQITYCLRRIEEKLLCLLRRSAEPDLSPAQRAKIQAVGRDASGALVELWPAVCDLQELLGGVADLRQLADGRYPWLAARDTVGAALDRLASFRKHTETVELLALESWQVAAADAAGAPASAIWEIADDYHEMCNDLDAVAGILNFVATERSAHPPAPAAVDPLPGRVEALFRCQMCGTPAGVVAAYWTCSAREKRPGGVHVFSPAVGLVEPIAAARSGPLQAALLAGDAKALFDLDPRWAPFYCSPCAAAYCGEHWTVGTTFNNGHYAGTRALCPNRHVRLLEG